MVEKKEFQKLRANYHKFIYESYEIKDTDNEIELTFHFIIEGLASFHPTMKIAKKGAKFLNTDHSYVRNLVFHIGMVELISYWKCACPKEVIIKAGYLNEEQINWFEKLYYLGLRRISLP